MGERTLSVRTLAPCLGFPTWEAEVDKGTSAFRPALRPVVPPPHPGICGSVTLPAAAAPVGREAPGDSDGPQGSGRSPN